jgi:hypothetical protein
VRIDEAVSRTESPTQHIVDAKLRHHLYDIVRRNPLDVRNTQRVLSFAIGFQVSHMLFICRTEQITVCAVIRGMSNHLIELRKEVDRVLRHLNIHRRRELRAHAAHAFAGGPFTLVGLTLDHQHIGRSPVAPDDRRHSIRQCHFR